MPSEWEKSVTDKDLHYISFVNESFHSVLLEANESDVQFVIDFIPNNQPGCGSLKAVFTNHNTGTVLDTIEYQIAINDSNCITTSTTSTIDESISIFPNPTTGIVQLRNTTTIRELSLYNLNGKKILSDTTSLGELDLTDFLSGVYILKVQTSNQKQQVFRILKE